MFGADPNPCPIATAAYSTYATLPLFDHHQPHNLLYPYSKVHDHPDSYEDDITDMSFFEGIYLLLLSGAGVSLGYLAANLSWPANFAPLVGLSVLLYLITTHRSALSPPYPLGIRLPPSPTDEESFLPISVRDMSEKGPLAGEIGGNDELKAILGQKRQGAVAGVYAFGKGLSGGAAGGPGQVWVIVEDMDA